MYIHIISGIYIYIYISIDRQHNLLLEGSSLALDAEEEAMPVVSRQAQFNLKEGLQQEEGLESLPEPAPVADVTAAATAEGSKQADMKESQKPQHKNLSGQDAQDIRESKQEPAAATFEGSSQANNKESQELQQKALSVEQVEDIRESTQEPAAASSEDGSKETDYKHPTSATPDFKESQEHQQEAFSVEDTEDIRESKQQEAAAGTEDVPDSRESKQERAAAIWGSSRQTTRKARSPSRMPFPLRMCRTFLKAGRNPQQLALRAAARPTTGKACPRCS